MSGTAPVFSDSVADDGNTLKVVTDKTLAGGEYKFSISDGNITITASDYQGFGAALDYMMDAYDTKGQFFTLSNGIEHTSNYKKHLTDITSSSEYAYTKVGSTRIMFYNILFMGSASGYTFPPEARDYLQIEMLKLYRPDVVGFQEFRTGTIVGVNGETIGERDRFMAMLDELGYVPTILQGDERIDNATKSCYVPVYYNPETTELIESDFYTYASQSNNMPKDYFNTPQSIRDTKSMTWAVFKEKASGRQYIVVNTHMAGQSENLSDCQAMEAIATINELCSRYDAPLFMGGDLNSGVNNGKNYQYLIDSGMEHARDVANFHSSKTYAAHTYPDYDADIGMILPAGGMKLDTDQKSIDHILLENMKDVRVNLCGVVVDICTAAGSDHLPMFVDISFT
jgi:endonuclease/exonuclease/phosphatase family metal-dependent hydrolase